MALFPSASKTSPRQDQHAVTTKQFPSTKGDRVTFPDIAWLDGNRDHVFQLRNRSCTEQQMFPSPQHLAIPLLYRPTVSPEERQAMLMTLQTFIRAVESQGLTYFLYGGSLLGAFRHHGFIPWDDDIDVLLNRTVKNELKQVLSAVQGYSLKGSDKMWKFFPNNVHRPTKLRKHWPFVDIFFFAENSTHIWDEIPGWSKRVVYRKQDVFPLGKYPFEGAMLPVPRDIGAFLRQTYSVDMCASPYYCHKVQEIIPTTSTQPCSLLAATLLKDRH